MSAIVLVVDMVRGFLEPGHNLYCGDEARGIIPNVQRLLEREAAAGAQVLFISDHHLPDDLEFQMFPVHCVIGTEEPEVIPELAQYVTASNVVPKNRYSGFFNTDLEQRLEAMGAGQADNLRGLHRHLRHAHHLGRPQPGLPGGGAGGLRRHL